MAAESVKLKEGIYNCYKSQNQKCSFGGGLFLWKNILVTWLSDVYNWKGHISSANVKHLEMDFLSSTLPEVDLLP